MVHSRRTVGTVRRGCGLRAPQPAPASRARSVPGRRQKGGLGAPFETGRDGGTPLARPLGALAMQPFLGRREVRREVVLGPIRGVTPQWRRGPCNPGAAVTT